MARAIGLPVAEPIAKKTLLQRRDVRQKRFPQFFAGARSLSLDVPGIEVDRTYFGSGTRLEARELRSLTDGLECDVVYGERIVEGLLVVIRGAWSRLCVDRLGRRCGTGRVMSVMRLIIRDCSWG